jgi:hypothetical protein
MRIVIVAVGTWGDVAPYTRIADEDGAGAVLDGLRLA